MSSVKETGVTDVVLEYIRGGRRDSKLKRDSVKTERSRCRSKYDKLFVTHRNLGGVVEVWT